MKTIKNLKAEEIRKSILQLAIQGKLVKQDPNDEPASELVKRIYAEKQRLIKEGKIKKDKNESFIFKGDDNCYYEKIGNSAPVKLEDLPFDIPDNWAWIRLKSLANIFNGNSINEEEKRKKYMGVEGRDFIATKDVGFDRTIAYNNGVNIPYDSAFKIAPAGKVLMCIEGGSAGRKIAITDKDVCFGNKLACFDTVIISDLYLFHILQSNEFLSIFKSSLSGIIGGVSINTLKDFIIPLPPIEEELRIVEKINSFEPLIAQYSTAENRLSVLEEEFPDKLKKSILQYAIEGKLVKQDPNDEPASVLLERIKAEKEKLIKEGKIKRDKNESYIYQGDDKNYYEKIGSNIQKVNEPFGIPNYWKWVQIKEIFIHSAGKALNSSNTEGKKYPYITTSNVYWNSFVLENLKTMYYKDSEIEKCSATKGDLLVLEGGDIGRVAIWNYDYDIRIQNHIHRLRPLNGVNVEFYYLVFFLYKNSNSIEGRGIGLQGLSANRLKSLVVPLPTYHEQLIIVEAINKIFDLI